MNNGLREAALLRLQLLEADNIRLRLSQPAQQDRETAVEAVDVEGCDLHRNSTLSEPPVSVAGLGGGILGNRTPERGLRVAPFVGIGYPGIIQAD